MTARVLLSALFVVGLLGGLHGQELEPDAEQVPVVIPIPEGTDTVTVNQPPVAPGNIDVNTRNVITNNLGGEQPPVYQQVPVVSQPQVLLPTATAVPPVANPTLVANPGVVNPTLVANPGVVNPGYGYPGVVNPGVVNPGVVNPGVVNPTLVGNPGVVNPGVVNPGVTNTGFGVRMVPLGAALFGRTGLGGYGLGGGMGMGMGMGMLPFGGMLIGR